GFSRISFVRFSIGTTGRGLTEVPHISRNKRRSTSISTVASKERDEKDLIVAHHGEPYHRPWRDIATTHCRYNGSIFSSASEENIAFTCFEMRVLPHLPLVGPLRDLPELAPVRVRAR